MHVGAYCSKNGTKVPVGPPNVQLILLHNNLQVMKTENRSATELILLATLACLGFYGGTGFFIVIDGNPSIVKMSSATFAEYWQHLDFYMAARRRVFVPAMLLLTIASVVVLYRKYTKTSFILISVAFLVLVIDVISA
jgi:hypothetical protein